MAPNAIETVCLLVASQEPGVLRSVWSIAKSNLWHLETASSSWEAVERLRSGVAPDLLLLELSGSDSDGLHVLRWLRRLRPDLPIILISHSEDAGRNQDAIRFGVEMMLMPLEEQQLEFIIRRSLGAAHSVTESAIRSEDVERIGDASFFIAASPVMRNLRVQAELLAQAQVPVLIVGESGSGKSSAAQLIHGLSFRSELTLLTVNCAALPGHLLSEELFGCERNGEPGFARSRAGKLELCDNGTLLLDEIVEMPLDVQQTLLQVLKSKQLVRPGGDIPIGVDVRIIAATSADINHALVRRKLCEELYYRLSAFTLHVPPLRERKMEIPLFLHHFMQQFARHYGMPPRTFSPAALEACQSHSWPENLNELERFVKRYLMIPDHKVESVQVPVRRGMADVGHSFPRPAASLVPVASDSWEPAAASDSLKSLLQSVKIETERNAITAALQKTGWNRKAAARLLSVSYRTMLYKIGQYKLAPPERSIPSLYARYGSQQ